MCVGEITFWLIFYLFERLFHGSAALVSSLAFFYFGTEQGAGQLNHPVFALMFNTFQHPDNQTNKTVSSSEGHGLVG